MFLLALRELEQVFAFAPREHGLFRLKNNTEPLAANIIPARVNRVEEFSPNHFICGNADTSEANITPMPSITKRLGKAQHIKVEKDVNNPNQSIVPESEGDLFNIS